MQYQFVKIKAAAVQAAPVYLDGEATADKACNFIKEAATNGASIIAFPEAYIPGYPHWVWLDSPGDEDRFFKLFVRNCVNIPGPITDRLCQMAREYNIYVIIGINETSPYSFAEIFNTNLLLNPEGQIFGRHRKIMPTYAEKLVWSFGDGSSLRTYDTGVGRLGTLICGENTNSLARFALIAQAEQIHVSNYPAHPTKGRYDLKKAIEIRSATHSFEGKLFNIVSSSIINDEMRNVLGDTKEKQEVLANAGNGFTGIIGPDGKAIAGPIEDDEEDIVYADIDLGESIKWKQFHDISGNYNRFDILSLALNRESRVPIKRWEDTRKFDVQKTELLSRFKKKLNEIDEPQLKSELFMLFNEINEAN